METGQLIHDTRRVSVWLGLLAFPGGVGTLWLAAHIAASHLFGYKLIPATGESGSPVLGFLGALGLGLFFVSVPFLRNRIFYDSEHHQVLIEHSGLFGLSHRRIPLESATGVEIKGDRTPHGGTHWSIYIRFGDGRSEWLTQLQDADEAEGVGKALSEAAQAPLLKT